MRLVRAERLPRPEPAPTEPRSDWDRLRDIRTALAELAAESPKAGVRKVARALDQIAEWLEDMD